MAASFPSSVWAGYTVVDLVSFWNAATANPISEEIVAVETFLISTVRADGVALIGPASGGPLAPTWRALVGTDVPEATDAARGTIEMATDAETTTGTATDRALTPANLRSDVPLVPAVLKGVRLDASGHLIMPHDGQAQFRTLAQANFNYMTTYSATAADHWELLFDKSHQDTVGNTVTVTGEALGGIGWRGNSGAAMTNAAAIIALQNGAAGTHTPADIVIYTSPGNGDRAEAGRFTKDGHLVMAASHDINLANGRSIGIDSSNERVEFYTAGYVAVMGASLGVGVASPGAQVHISSSGTDVLKVQRASETNGATTRLELGTDTTYFKSMMYHQRADGVTNGLGGLRFAVDDTDDAADVSTAEIRLAIEPSGDIGIGSLAIPTANGGKVLFFGDNTADPTMDADTGGMYCKDVAGTVEVFVMSEDDVAVQLTAHNYELFDPIAGTLHWAPSHTNRYAGQQKVYDMERALLALEALTGETFIHTRQLPASERRNWEQDQRARLRAALGRGEKYQMKARPAWL